MLQSRSIRDRAAVAVKSLEMSAAKSSCQAVEKRASTVLRISTRTGELQLEASAPDYTSILQPCVVKKWVSGGCLGDGFEQ